MKVPFNPYQGLVVIPAILEGPLGAVQLRLALDLGATGTIVNSARLTGCGYNPATATRTIQINSVGGAVSAPQLVVNALLALGKRQQSYPVAAHTVSTSSRVDGLLGLDFLRGHLLTVDFRTGQIELT